jgi:hypothetical protein
MTLTDIVELLIVVGTLRRGVPVRVQRAEHKAYMNHLTEPLRRCTRRGQRSALSLPLCWSKA